MNITVWGEENMLSPHIGQSASVADSMHLWSLVVEMAMQARQVCCFN